MVIEKIITSKQVGSDCDGNQILPARRRNWLPRLAIADNGRAIACDIA
jgi:hypothetical protein